MIGTRRKIKALEHAGIEKGELFFGHALGAARLTRGFPFERRRSPFARHERLQRTPLLAKPRRRGRSKTSAAGFALFNIKRDIAAPTSGGCDGVRVACTYPPGHNAGAALADKIVDLSKGGTRSPGR
ncbi:MAG: hypothetical protein WBD78_12630 [Methylocella sp.]